MTPKKKKLEKKRPDELTNDEVIERLFGKTVLKELKDVARESESKKPSQRKY